MVDSAKLKNGAAVKTAFDEYTIIKQVGSGGNGRVVSAQNSNGESVAIKFIERNVSSDKLKRFKNEIYFCEQHKHKNIVEIQDRGYAVLDDKEYIFYVMPLYKETLRDKMKTNLSPEQAVAIFIGLLEGLSYAHKKGTIHRDIKPENIMFKADSLEPIICDFGIAHFADEELLTIIETKKSDRMANFQYAAPEQRIKGKQATGESDIYAIALILNEMFTGEIPQAANYTTIESAAPEYKFLDEIFVQIYKQNPFDRLYPEEKILTEMKVLAEQYKRDQEKIKLQNTINDLITPEHFEISIIDKQYHNGKIVFIMDKNIPQRWFHIITQEVFSHGAMKGYEKYKLIKGNTNELCMPLRGNEREDTMRKIWDNVIDWVRSVNNIYSNWLKEEAKEEQRRKENARKEAIEKIERENALADIIKNL